MPFALAASALLAPVAAQQSSVVVDRIVAVVGERLVLQSDLDLEQALSPLEDSPVAALMGPSADPLQVVIDRAIIRGLAGNAAIYVPSDTDVRDRVTTIRSHFADDTAWNAFLLVHGLDADRLASLLYSRLVVDRYIERNLQQAERGAAAYAEWISHHRARVPIRLVPAIDDMVPGR